MHRKLLLTALLGAFVALAACSRSEPQAPAAAEPMPEPAAQPAVEVHDDLRSLLASELRAEADRARDAGRKPADVIEFLGIEPGMKVMDVLAAGGYYTEVLSLAVGSDGEVVALNTPGMLQYRDGAYEKAISERLADGRLPNVSRLNANLAEIGTYTDSIDAAITALNFHDIYNRNGAEAAVGALQAVFDVLEPGGVFGIIDHVGVAGNDNAALHRIEKAIAVETAIAAGFVVEEESDLLSNAGDDHTQGVFAEGLRGNTDRFVLKLRKPAG